MSAECLNREAEGVVATEERLAHLDAALKVCIQQISSLQAERETEAADLKQANKRLEGDKRQLMTRLDSIEKENAFLKCECCALERELLLKQPNGDRSQKSSRKIDILVDRLCDVEEENKALRGIIQATRDNQNQFELLASKQIIPVFQADATRTLAKSGESDLNRSICRMVELIEEIIPPTDDESPTCTDLDYSVHVFRWRNSELIPILREFIVSCSLVLNGSHGLNEFAMQLASVLEFAVENCIPLENASRVRDGVRKHFNLERSRSEIDVNNPNAMMTKMIKIQSDLQEENQLLKLKLKSAEFANKDLENKLEESKERIAGLQEEVEDANESRGDMEDQIEHLKSINEDLDTQLTVAKVKQNEMMHKLSSLEVEFEDKNQSCEELETTCLELQLQLEILSRKGSPYLEEKQIGWELMSDCSKLALVVHETCKESDPSDDELDKGKGNQHYSLRDRMLADDDDDGTRTKERVCGGGMEKALKHRPDTDENKALAVVPIKKQGGGFGFIRKMLLRRRRKRGTNKASTLLQRDASQCSKKR